MVTGAGYLGIAQASMPLDRGVPASDALNSLPPSPWLSFRSSRSILFCLIAITYLTNYLTKSLKFVLLISEFYCQIEVRHH